MTEERTDVVERDDKVLEGIDLVKEFVQGAVTLRVLAGASITVRAGERIAIVGASGSGKTTLLQLLGGLDLPTRGTVKIAGAAMNRLNDKERGRLRNQAVGFVYQFHHLLPEFTALENVAMPLLVRRTGAPAQRPLGRRRVLCWPASVCRNDWTIDPRSSRAANVSVQPWPAPW